MHPLTFPTKNLPARGIAVLGLLGALICQTQFLAAVAADANTKAEEPAARSWFTHPALNHGLVTNPHATPEQLAALRTALEGQGRDLLALTDAQQLALLPDQTPRIHNACPACARSHPVPIPEQPQPFPGIFDPRHPDRIQCENCGTVFPNAEYPMNRTEVLRNLVGEDVTVPYYVDPNGKLNPVEARARMERRYYLNGVIDTARKNWLVPRLSALGQLYQLTRDERYARPVVRLLDAFAARYPHYLLTTDYGHRYATTLGKRPPYGFLDTRWGRRSGEDSPADLLSIFDLVASSPAMDPATKGRIVEAFFLNSLRKSPGPQRERRGLYGNGAGAGGMIDRARALESPALMHEAYRFLRDTPRYATECDGMFLDSAGYASLFRFAFFQGARKMDGYSDPPGYVDPVDGLHLENVYPLKENEDFFRALATVAYQLRLPSGGIVSYNDSGSGWGPAYWSAYGDACQPLERSRNLLLPGLHRAILGAGSGDKQIQVHLDFSENGVNHAHQDGLALQIYAYGHSLIDDFTYHKSRLRRYAEMTVAHQTVVINQQNQNRSYTDGDVEFYAPLMDGVSAIRVDNRRVYPGLAGQYARTLVLNSINPDAMYVLDVFEVAGGTLHDYQLHSSAQHHESLAVSIPTTPVPGLRPLMAPGESWTEPTVQREGLGTGYGLLFNVQRADVPTSFNFTFTCDDPWAGPVRATGGGGGQQRYKLDGAYKAGPDSWPDRPAIGTRHHVALGPGYELLTAESPSLMEAGFTGSDQPSGEWPKLPHVILRHRVEKDGRSVFVVVHEPYHHAPRIQSVARLDTGSDQVLALRIRLPDREDNVVYALDKPRDVSLSGVEMSGRLGLISRVAGKTPRAYLVEGTKLIGDGVKLANSASSYSGAIRAMERRWNNGGANRFRVDAALPAGDALRGSVIVVQNGPMIPLSQNPDAPDLGSISEANLNCYSGSAQAFPIDRVAVEQGQTWVYTAGDHGLIMQGDQVREFYVPGRLFRGASRFVIPTFATTDALAPSPREQPLAGLKPAAEASSGLNPGLLAEVFTGVGYDLGSLKPEGRQRVDRLDAKRFEIRRQGRVAARYTGYLRVPADGIYTFYVGATSECRMTLGEVPVIEQFHGQSLMPDVREVKLAAGLYPLRLEYFYGGTGLPPWFEAEWAGPGLPRQDLLKAAFIAEQPPTAGKAL